MKVPLFTIIIPTHNHAALLPWALRSLQNQSLSEFEAFIVGDGATVAVSQTAQRFVKDDARFSWFSFPKSPRTGEIYRHELITTKAQGKYIAYLADDDLWRPDHLVTLATKLKTHAFVAAKPITINEQGEVGAFFGLIADSRDRANFFKQKNFIPLSCAAHQRRAYSRLPYGWRSTPVGTPTDLYMWQQWADTEGITYADCDHFTVVNFPSPPRKNWSTQRRVQELKAYSHLISDTTGWLQLQEKMNTYLFKTISEYKHMPEEEKLKRLTAEDELQRLLDSKVHRTYQWVKKHLSYTDLPLTQ